jgi:D-hexose-6-phosphate mutarotase
MQRQALAPFLNWTRIGELDVLELDAPYARARIAVQGAHLLDWTPAGQQPVLWLSGAAQFKTDKAIRGGVPLCWPWFGPHPEEAHPSHGFARTSEWRLEAAQTEGEGAVLVWTLLDDEHTRSRWPYPFRLRYTQRIGRELNLTLETEHLGEVPAHYSFALHSYFNVGDVEAAAIEGLDGARFADKLSGQDEVQRGALTLNGAMDRVYLCTGGRFRLQRAAGLPALDIVGEGCPSAIVWNPWQEGADKLADMGGEGWRGMLCLENGAALGDAFTLAPGAKHRASVTVKLS